MAKFKKRANYPFPYQNSDDLMLNDYIVKLMKPKNFRVVLLEYFLFC